MRLEFGGLFSSYFIAKLLLNNPVKFFANIGYYLVQLWT